MAVFELSCPHCGEVLEGTDDMIGAVVECPGCQKEFNVEGPGDPAEEAEAGEGATPVVNCPECGRAMPNGSVLCVACGFHTKLGKKISTEFG